MSRASAAMLRLLSERELRWMIADRGTPESTRLACHDEIARREAVVRFVTVKQ